MIQSATVKTRKALPRTLVRLSLLSKFARCFDGGFGAVLVKISIRHDFTTYKFVLEIRAKEAVSESSRAKSAECDILNHTSGLRCLGALPDSPCANLVWSACKVSDEL
jgi:hypothetical protein